MEAVTIIIAIVVFVISALLLYCISAISMREKTFEEVMAEQKRREEEEREKVKAEKKAERDQQKKKYKKGKHEKVKEKAAQLSEPESKVDKKVNLETEPEIIESGENVDHNTDLKHRGKKDKSKSILHNRGEHTPVAEKASELLHKVVPKDELELKRSHEKAVIEKSEILKPVHAEPLLENESKTKHSVDTKENLSPKKAEKEKEHKSKQHTDDVAKHLEKQTDVSAQDGALIISTVKQAKLTDSEMQNLIDILLNKQGLKPGSSAASDSWNKKSQKGDPVAQLKKQLEEKEKALQDEQSAVVSANTHVKELRSELQAEKNKSVTLEKRLQEKIGHQQSELDALQQRMQYTHNQHLHETSTLQARIRTLEQSSDKATIQKLNEVNKILQENLSQKVSENMRLSQASETAKNMESKVSVYEEKICKLETTLKEADSKNQKQIEEIAQKLHKAEAKNASLSSDVQKANSSLTTAQAEVNNLKVKLQERETQSDTSRELEARLYESEQKCFDLEGNVKNLDKQMADLSHILSEGEAEIKRLLIENKKLSDENKTISEQLQTAPAANGDILENGHKVSLAEHERIVSEKSCEISNLTSSLETQKKSNSTLQSHLETKALEVTELQDQLNQQKKKNNELREKNWKAMEALDKTEKSATERVNKAMEAFRKEVDVKVQKQIEEISQELQKAEAKNTSLKSDVQKANNSLTASQAEVSTLKTKLETQSGSSSVAEESEQKSVKNLQKQLEDLSLRLSNSEAEIMHLQQENKTLCTENRTLNVQLQAVHAANGTDVLEKSNEINGIATNLENQKKAVSNLQSQLDTKCVEVAELTEQLEQQRKKNNELRERNWKAMEALEKSEKSAAERIKAVKSAQQAGSTDSSAVVVKETEVLKHELEVLKKDLKLSNSQNEKLKHIEDEYNQLKSTLTAGSVKANVTEERCTDLESENRNMKLQLEKYKRIVTETESKLRQLEKSVEDEETKWLEKLRQVQSQPKQDANLSGRMKEFETLVCQQKSQIESYRHVLSLADHNLKELESKIEAEENVWKGRIDQSQTEIQQLQAKVDSKEKELKDAQKQIVLITETKETQLVKIYAELENEQKVNKELKLNIVKLNSIIKIGQDALSEEQGLVEQLQESLHSHSTVTSNI